MRRLGRHAWAYVAAGLAAGALVGAVRSAWGPAYRDSTARTLSQELFERGITAPPGAGFRVRGVVVHPPEPDGVCWVTGTYAERGARGLREGPFKFRATRPYVPRLAVASTEAGGLTVARYLDELAARVPQAELHYRFAWWERPGAAIVLWAAVGMVVGVARALIRRTARGADPGHAAEAGTAVPSYGASGPQPPDAIAPPIPVHPKKAFGGEFYPTEVHADDSLAG
jgi:hypothetical protein